MARFIYQGTAQDASGTIIKEATVTVYLAGGTTSATIYEAETGAAASTNTVETSATTGRFLFWVDDSDYASTQRFKIIISKSAYTSQTYDNINIYGVVSATTSATGVIEIATDAEALAKSATDKALVASNLAALDASATFAGVIEIATNAETEAKSATDKAIVPSNLASIFLDEDAMGSNSATKICSQQSIKAYADSLSGGASEALDNLSSVAINTSLISDTDSTDDLGSAAKYWANAYVDEVYTPAIQFPATAVASGDANTLDDYEEGTWTPVYSGSGGSAGATAYSVQTGTYTKIGRLVTIHCRITLTNNGDWSGNVVIDDVPFTVAYDAVGTARVGNITYDANCYAFNQTGGALYIGIDKSATASAILQTTGVPDDGAFYVTITFHI